MQKYYSLETANNVADLYIFGDITSYPWDEKDKDAYGVVKELQKLEADTINVHINSYGGDVSEGLAIYNTLKAHKAEIITICDGFACSAASVIFMAGDIRIMNEASLLMIHNPWTYACGNANEFRKQAEDLDKIAQASINAYMSKVNIEEDELKSLLDNETWLTAQDCLEKGFATAVSVGNDDGLINQSAFQNIREKILAKKELVNSKINAEEIANLVFEKLCVLTNAVILSEPKEEKTKESAWGSYFYGGK